MSFIDYKNLCKAVSFETDPNKLILIFDRAIKEQLYTGAVTDVIDKILLLLSIRGLVLGNDIQLVVGNKNITMSVEDFVTAFDKAIEPFVYEYNNLKLLFGPPKSFISSSSLIDCVEYSLIQHPMIDELVALPVKDITDKLIKHFKDFKYQVTTLDNFELSIYNESFIHFFKLIFDGDFASVLELEYQLRKNLGYNLYDLEKTSYAETKVMITKHIQELEASDKIMDPGKSEISD